MIVYIVMHHMTESRYDIDFYNPVFYYNFERMERGKAKREIDTLSLKMLFSSDLDKLLHVVGTLVKMTKEVNEWSVDEYVSMTIELDKFYSIHYTRTEDLINTLERLDKAKYEYAKLKAMHDELIQVNEKQASIISELLNRGA